MWPRVDLRAEPGQKEAHPLLCAWNVRSVHYSHARNLFQGRNLERVGGVETIWTEDVSEPR